MNPDQMPINSQRDNAAVPEWDGRGMPPVGCECEWSDSGRPHKRVLVMGYYGESAWLRIMDSQTPLTVHASYDSFHPLRSEEDRAVDRMECAYLRGDSIGGRPAAMREVYRAIRDGKMPGVKLEGT